MSDPFSSQAFTVVLCVAVWLLMALLPVLIYRLARRGRLKWLCLLLTNIALWAVWFLQYHILRSNPAWATSSARTWLLLIEAGGSAAVLFGMMVRERGKVRERNLRRLEWDG